MKNIYTITLMVLMMVSGTSYSQTVSGYYSVGCTAYQQEHSQWCWAAACRIVDWTYSSVTPPSQCSIVNRANNQCDIGSCCGTLNGSRPSACVDWSPSNQPNNMYNCNGSLSWLINYYAGANTAYGSSLAYSTVSTNLYNNKMMVARWGWTSGGGHFVVIYACYTLIGSTINNYVLYANPSSGSKVTENYNYFKSNTSRTWTHSLRMNGAAVRRDGMIAHEVMEMENAVRIYPNPSTGIISLESGELSDDAMLQISNALGETVFETEINNTDQSYSFDLSDKLSRGIYFVNLLNNGERRTGKLIVQ